MQKIILLLATGMLLISSCKKASTASPSAKDLLTAKTWKSTGNISDGTPSAEWCDLNSLWDFTVNGVLFYTQGDNMGACSGPAIGDVVKYSWKLSSDNQWMIRQYKTVPSEEQDSFQIVSINETTFKTKRVVNKNTASPDTWEDTFTAQ